MYKFENGLVFYSKADADRAIKAGYKLLKRVETKPKKEAIEDSATTNQKPINQRDKEYKDKTRKN